MDVALSHIEETILDVDTAETSPAHAACRLMVSDLKCHVKAWASGSRDGERGVLDESDTSDCNLNCSRVACRT